MKNSRVGNPGESTGQALESFVGFRSSTQPTLTPFTPLGVGTRESGDAQEGKTVLYAG